MLSTDAKDTKQHSNNDHAAPAAAAAAAVSDSENDDDDDEPDLVLPAVKVQPSTQKFYQKNHTMVSSSHLFDSAS